LIASAPRPASRPSIERARALRPFLLLIGGVALIAYLVQRTDPRQVLAALERAGAWLPALAALEALLLLTDTAAFATLIASARGIPARGWLRSSAASYVCLVLLPAGRAVGEAARAALATPYTGAKRALTAGAELQAVALIADGLVSFAAACVVFRALGATQHLAAALFVNGLLVSVAGLALLYVMRRTSVGTWVLRRAPRLARLLPQGARAPSAAAWRAAAWSVLGRALQVIQYGVAVFAVGGAFAVRSAFVAHGVHMVGATVGVALPNQVGVADAAYVVFADALGFRNEPARALAAMLSVRCAQLLLAGVCLSVVAFVREPSPKPSPVG
jgi:hypothetical protein